MRRHHYLAVALWLWSAIAWAGSATLSWVPPTQNTDGTALEDLASYRIHYGSSPDALTATIPIDNPSLTTYIVEDLSDGTWYFALTAINAEGVSSAVSNVASKTIAGEPIALPGAPQDLQVTWQEAREVATPTVAGTATTSQTSDATSHTVNLPASIASGDLLVMQFGKDGGAGPATATGWTEITDGFNEGTAAVRQTWLYRVADGGEGATVTVTTPDSQRSAAIVYRITGHDTGQAPEGLTAGSAAGGGSDSPDAPSLTPTGGAKDYLWLWGCALDRGDNTLTAGPTNYTDTGTVNMTSFAAGGVTIHFGRRALNASSEDPGIATNNQAEEWAAATIAVHPAAAAGNDMTAAGSVSVTGAASLNATGALQSAGSLSVTGAADLDAVGSLAAAGSLSIAGAADLDATGSLLAAGALSISGVADLDAPGSLAAAGSLSISGVADLTGANANDIAAAGSLSITGLAPLTAIGQLVASGSISVTGVAQLSKPAETTETFSGGYFYDFDYEWKRRRREREERERREAEAAEIEEETNREIALLLHKQEALDARRQELQRLSALVDTHAGRISQAELSDRVARAVSKAAAKGTRWALLALEREIKRARDEEEFVLQALWRAVDYG